MIENASPNGRRTATTGVPTQGESDMAKNPGQVTLSVDLLTSAVAEVESIDQAIGASKQAKQVLAEQARYAVLTSWDAGLPLAEWIESVRQAADEVESQMVQWADELANMAMSGSSENVALLNERRAELVANAEALRTVLVNMKVSGAADVVIPAAKKGKTSTGTKGVKTSNVHFYRVRNGVRSEVSPSQDDLSAQAYYLSAKVNGTRMSAVDFRAYLLSKISPTDTRSAESILASGPWEVRLSDDLVLGCEAVPTDEA